MRPSQKVRCSGVIKKIEKIHFYAWHGIIFLAALSLLLFLFITVKSGTFSQLWFRLLRKTIICFIVLVYKLFWKQACPEGIGTNGTHRSHARCHPYPIPQPVKVGHTTGVYVPYSFRTVVWVLLRPTRTDH